MNLVLFNNPRQQISTASWPAATAELARCGGDRRVAVCTSRGQSYAATDHYSITGWGAEAA